MEDGRIMKKNQDGEFLYMEKPCLQGVAYPGSRANGNGKPLALDVQSGGVRIGNTPLN